MDINNLSKYNDNDNIDEVYRIKEMRVAQQEQIIEQKQQNISQHNSMSLNEVIDFSRLDVVTYDLFERVNCSELTRIHKNIR